MLIPLWTCDANQNVIVQYDGILAYMNTITDAKYNLHLNILYHHRILNYMKLFQSFNTSTDSRNQTYLKVFRLVVLNYI